MKTVSVAFLFPGQGSQAFGMGLSLAHTFPSANNLFLSADEVLGFSLSKIAWEGPEEDLNDTINTQPALLTHSVAVLTVLGDLYPQYSPSFIAGHSMGEISALVAAYSMTFSDALMLVRKRGELMKRSGLQAPGGMAAVLGLDIPSLDRVCEAASKPGEIVQVANDNCPGQVVISGSNKALDRAIQLSSEAGAKRVIRLPVSIAAHSPLMSSAQADFNHAVSAAEISDPIFPIIGNVSSSPLINAQAIRLDLCDQLTHRVRWTETIQFMLNAGVNTFFEIGTGSVLTGLVKRIDRQASCYPLGTPEDLEKLRVSI